MIPKSSESSLRLDFLLQDLILHTMHQTAQNQSPDKRNELASALRGQRIEIPDLRDIFRSWPKGVNPERRALHDHVSQIVVKYDHFYLSNKARSSLTH